MGNPSKPASEAQGTLASASSASASASGAPLGWAPLVLMNPMLASSSSSGSPATLGSKGRIPIGGSEGATSRVTNPLGPEGG
eukprot:885249-Prorocentrum_minimum.AAC.2